MRLHYNTTRLHLEQLEDRRLLSLSAAGDYAVGDYPLSVTVADFNADGRPDLATLNRNHNVSVLLGSGNGMFAPAQHFPAAANYIASIAAADLNGDSKQDLLTAGDATFITVHVGNGDGTFQSLQTVSLPPPPDPPRTYLNHHYAIVVTAADFDADGNVDVVAACQYEFPDPDWVPDSPNPPNIFIGNYLSVLRGSGNGTFAVSTLRTTGYVSDVEAEDLNSDGMLDLVLDASGTLHVLLGAGDGTFSANQYYSNGTGTSDAALALADFNGDGNTDVAVPGIFVVAGNGNGGFGPLQFYLAGSSYTHSVATADFNVDGWPDLVTGHIGTFDEWYYVDGTVSVLLNDGAGGFLTPIVMAAGPGGTWPIVLTADFNGDGRPDVGVVSVIFSPGSAAGNVRVLLNDGNWPAVAPTLPGDYNANGAIDAADYVVWRKALGSNAANFSGADGNGNGVVDEADHGVWRANFGNTLPSPAAGSYLSSIESNSHQVLPPEEAGNDAEPVASVAAAAVLSDKPPKTLVVAHDVIASQRRVPVAARPRFVTAPASATFPARQNELLTSWLATVELYHHRANECQGPIGSSALDDVSDELREVTFDIALELLGQQLAWSPLSRPMEPTDFVTAKNQ